MALNIDKALGIYPHTLELRVKRAELIANNIANQDTPGFKAQDINFKSLLQEATSASNASQAMKTDSAHQNGFIDFSGAESIQYRLPSQPSIDGNTVNSEVEKAEYAKNSLRFQTSFLFLNGAIKAIKDAIRGE